MKKKYFRFCVPLIIGLIILLSNPLFAFTETDTIYVSSASISGTWSPEHRYIVLTDISISDEDTLTILPGTFVEFSNGKSMEVSGVLQAQGTIQNKISFTPVNEQEYWGGIRFFSAKRSDRLSTVQYCTFENVGQSAGAVLSVNNRINNIVGCEFENIQTNAIVLQTGCSNTELLITENVFIDIELFCVNIYQNFSLQNISVLNNEFHFNKTGIAIDVSMVSEFRFEENTIEGMQVSNSFVQVHNNPELITITIHSNEISDQINQGGTNPHLFEISGNMALDELIFTDNEVENSGRVLYVTDCENFVAGNNTILNSISKAFEYLMFLDCENITIENDHIENVLLNNFNALYTALYSCNPNGGNVTVSSCDFVSNQGITLYLRDFLAMNDVLLTNNVLTDGSSEEKNGCFLNISGGPGALVHEVILTDNQLNGLISADYGGAVAITIEGDLNGFLSNNNSFNTETGDAGGAVYIQCNEIGNLEFNSDNIAKSSINGTNPDMGKGGFLYLETTKVSNVISFVDCTFDTSTAVSDGGVADINISSADSFLPLLNIDNNSLGNVQSAQGFGGFLSLSTEGGLGNVFLHNCTAESVDAKHAVSGGLLHLEVNLNIDTLSVEGNQFKNFGADQQGGYISIAVLGQINQLYVDGNSFTNTSNVSVATPVLGGCVYTSAQNLEQVLINNNSFNNMMSSSDGGGVWIQAQDMINELSVTENQFDNCYAGGNGGGIYLTSNNDLSNQLILEHNNFTTLSAAGNGGGCFFDFHNGILPNGLSVLNNSFQDCSATNSGSGGGVYLHAKTIADTLNLEDTEFLSCVADANGGGMYVSTESLDAFVVDGNEDKGFSACVAENGSGGGIYLEATAGSIGVIEIRDILSTGNGSMVSASGNGGGICLISNGDLLQPLVLSGVVFENVSSSGNGGAAYIDLNGHIAVEGLDLTNNSFVGCKALGDGASGGALFFSAKKVLDHFSVMEIEFNNCEANHSGGGLNFIGESIQGLNISNNSNIDQCAAFTGNGGAIALNLAGPIDQDLIIANNLLSGSSSLENAGLNGGALYISGVTDVAGDILISDNIFSSYSAVKNGGAIALLASDDANVNKVFFSNNRFDHCFTSDKGESGGALFLNCGAVADSIVFLHNVFDNCGSGEHGGAVYLKVKNAEALIIKGEPTQTEFLDCMAKAGSGGAVYAMASEGSFNDILIEDNDFVHNATTIVSAGESGGALFIESNGVVNDQFTLLENTFYGCNAGVNGGAISLNTNNYPLQNGLLIQNCSFSNLMAQGNDGGAIMIACGDISGPLMVSESMFGNCTAGENGGAISLLADNISTIEILNNQDDNGFTNCVAQKGAGGAVFISRSGLLQKISLINNDFSSATAGTNGGAVNLLSQGGLTEEFAITGNIFSEVSAGESGGAIACDFYNHELQNGVSIFDNQFVNCNAESLNDNGGGAISLMAGTVSNGITIEQDLFQICQAKNNGGAVYLKLNMLDSLFVDNNSEANGFLNCSATDGSGGSLHVSVTDGGLPFISFTNNKVVGNAQLSSGANGGAFSLAVDGDIDNIQIRDNDFSSLLALYKGGAIAIDLNPDAEVNGLTIEQNMFADLTAHRSGGAFSLTGGVIYEGTISNNEFNHNVVVDGNGGAIALESNFTTLFVNDNGFDGCYAAPDFSGQYGNGGSISLSYLGSGFAGACTMNDNSFLGSAFESKLGGAIFVNGLSQINVSDCDFKNLLVTEDGGAIFGIGTNRFEISNSSFTSCRALSSGGAIFIDGENVATNISIDNVYFQDNKSLIFGAALYGDNCNEVAVGMSKFYQNDISADYNGAIGGSGLYLSNCNQVQIETNEFFDNHVTNAVAGSAGLGGAMYLSDCQNNRLIDNKIQLNSATDGGGVCVAQDNKTTIRGNEFILNNAINGAGLYIQSDVSGMDSLSVLDNSFIKNTMEYRGGAAFVSRNKAYLFRNIFLRNRGFVNSSNDIIRGSSIYVANNVDEMWIYNSVFDRNEDTDNTLYNNATVFMEGNASSPFNSTRLKLENCSFLDNWPYAAHAVYNGNSQDTICIINSVFQGNLLQNDSLFNNAAIIASYSRLEGDLFDAAHTNLLTPFPYELNSGTYQLADGSFFIDQGMPGSDYNDNFMPPGLGADTNDPGITGGRYNTFCPTCLQKPQVWSYDDSLVVERIDCETYRIRFNNSVAADFNRFNWYVDGLSFETTENQLEFDYVIEKNVPIMAIGHSADSDDVIVGKAWIYNREIEHDGLQITYSPDGFGLDSRAHDTLIHINYAYDCLEDITFNVKLQGLKLPDPDSYTYAWAILPGDGISSAELFPIDIDDAQIILTITKDALTLPNIGAKITYNGTDECGFTCSDTLDLTFVVEGFELLEVIDAYPVNGASVQYNQLLHINWMYNQTPGINNAGIYEDLPLETDIADLNLFEMSDGISIITINSVFAQPATDGLMFTLYPDTSQITFDTQYTIVASEQLITKCGWASEPFDYKVNTVNTGMNELGGGIAEIYPVPVKNEVVIAFVSEFTGTLSIYNSLGSQVLSKDIINMKKSTLNMSHLPKGVYVIVYKSSRYAGQTTIIKE